MMTKEEQLIHKLAKLNQIYEKEFYPYTYNPFYDNYIRHGTKIEILHCMLRYFQSLFDKSDKKQTKKALYIKKLVYEIKDLVNEIGWPKLDLSNIYMCRFFISSKTYYDDIIYALDTIENIKRIIKYQFEEEL